MEEILSILNTIPSPYNDLVAVAVIFVIIAAVSFIIAFLFGGKAPEQIEEVAPEQEIEPPEEIVEEGQVKEEIEIEEFIEETGGQEFQAQAPEAVEEFAEPEPAPGGGYVLGAPLHGRGDRPAQRIPQCDGRRDPLR